MGTPTARCLFSPCSRGAGKLTPRRPGSSSSGPRWVPAGEGVSLGPSVAAPGSVPGLQPGSVAVSPAGPGAEQEVGPGVASPACPLPLPVRSLPTQSLQAASVSVESLARVTVRGAPAEAPARLRGHPDSSPCGHGSDAGFTAQNCLDGRGMSMTASPFQS